MAPLTHRRLVAGCAGGDQPDAGAIPWPRPADRGRISASPARYIWDGYTLPVPIERIAPSWPQTTKCGAPRFPIEVVEGQSVEADDREIADDVAIAGDAPSKT